MLLLSLASPAFLYSSIASQSAFFFMFRNGQLVRPGWNLKPFNLSLASTRRIFPGYFLSTAATTDSFSIGFNEQVEYEILPPTLRSSMPRSRIYI